MFRLNENPFPSKKIENTYDQYLLYITLNSYISKHCATESMLLMQDTPGNLFPSHFSFQLTRTATRCSGGIHAGILQYLDKLATKCTDVLFDLVHVVFRHALAFRLALLHGDVSSYQISHDTLIPKVPLGSLLDLSLRQESEIETLSLRKSSLQSTRYDTLYILRSRFVEPLHHGFVYFS